MADVDPHRASEQRAEVYGANNIVVQIEGDRNAVNLRGLAHLTLTHYLSRRRIDSDADLLSPCTRSIPLIGREPAMAELRFSVSWPVLRLVGRQLPPEGLNRSRAP